MNGQTAGLRGLEPPLSTRAHVWHSGRIKVFTRNIHTYQLYNPVKGLEDVNELHAVTRETRAKKK